MFNAVLGRKAGNVVDNENVPLSVGHILTGREDCRTATVFERLAYMPALEAWAILRRMCGSDALQACRIAELETIAFWPNWPIARSDRNHAQPDVYMRWSIGDPAVKVDMIIEVKPPNKWHGTGQWNDQLEAYRDTFSDEGPNVGEEHADRLIYMAFGGHMPRGVPQEPVWSAKQDEAAATGEPLKQPQFTFVTASWQDMAEAVGDLHKTGQLENVPAALVHDLIEALAFMGHVHFKMSDTILNMTRPSNANTSLETLSNWSLHD